MWPVPVQLNTGAASEAAARRKAPTVAPARTRGRKIADRLGRSLAIRSRRKKTGRRARLRPASGGYERKGRQLTGLTDGGAGVARAQRNPHFSDALPPLGCGPCFVASFSTE